MHYSASIIGLRRFKFNRFAANPANMFRLCDTRHDAPLGRKGLGYTLGWHYLDKNERSCLSGEILEISLTPN
jgi:hypothetical protein